MKVLIIPEDPSLDKYILKPIVERIFQDLERTGSFRPPILKRALGSKGPFTPIERGEQEDWVDLVHDRRRGASWAVCRGERGRPGVSSPP